jgi:hypothetical protein
MPAWGSTDSIYSKPLFPVERQVHDFIVLTTANNTTSGNTIVFQGTGALTAANLGVIPGMYITTPGTGSPGTLTSNIGVSGEPGFFISNVAVVSVTGNVVRLTSSVTGNIAAGTLLEFDNVISWPAGTANTYNQDTILVTPTRLANNTVNVGKTSTGWMYVLKTTNGGDGAVRYRSEVLVALANTLATNTASGNTSTGRIFSGV